MKTATKQCAIVSRLQFQDPFQSTDASVAAMQTVIAHLILYITVYLSLL